MRTGPISVSCASKLTVRIMVMNNDWWDDGLIDEGLARLTAGHTLLTKSSIVQTITCYFSHEFERFGGQKFGI